MWSYEETEQHLIRLVSNGSTRIFYSALYPLAGVDAKSKDSRDMFHDLLGQISRNHYAKNLPLLSVIVVGKNNNRPGPGFFKLARDINPDYKTKNNEDIYTFEIAKVQKHVSAYAQLLKHNHVATYLLTWNPSKSVWEDFQSDWENVYMGNRPFLEWSCGNTRKIKIGDRVFLMRLGWREKITGIMLSGVVTREPVENVHWTDEKSTTLYVEFEPDVFLNPTFDDLLDPDNVSQNFNWHPQRSGVQIPDEIAIELERSWQAHIQGSKTADITDDQSNTNQAIYLEGAKTPVSTYRYERDPRARVACIEHYGSKCFVCSFDFGESFGDIGEGFIHVHHLKPISERNMIYQIDPVADLRPVCPNCHAMLHRRNPPYSIEDLQHIKQEIRKRLS